MSDGGRAILVVGGESRAARAFRRLMAAQGSHALTVLTRHAIQPLPGERILVTTDYFDPPAAGLADRPTVINFAGIAHGEDEALLDAVNARGPVRLAQICKRQGVRHFLHLSSLHVYGYAPLITPQTAPHPQSVYGKAKLRADEGLSQLADARFAVSLLRIPMLYGGGSGENLRKLVGLMRRLPVLPVPRRPARRSVLHLDNLAACIATAVRQPLQGVSFAADADHFTLELLAEVMGEVIGQCPRLMRLPDAVFLPLRLTAKGVYSKLYADNLVLHSACIKPERGLPIALRGGLRDMLSSLQQAS